MRRVLWSNEIEASTTKPDFSIDATRRRLLVGRDICSGINHWHSNCDNNPQLAGQRRLLRSAAVPREIATQLPFARQQAMSQRQSFTFQYDNVAKQIKIIDNNATGSTVLNSSSYPNNTGSAIVLTSTLTESGLL